MEDFSQKKIPVLFVHRNSNYKKVPRFDCYDEERNALTVDSTTPAIYHPPCRQFSRLKGLAKKNGCEKLLGFWSIARARQYGGIVENPYDSDLFKIMNCKTVGSFDQYGGTFLVVDQFNYGFYTRKRTGLYIVGLKRLKDIPGLKLRFEYPERKFVHLTPKQRSETTFDFINFLTSIIDII